MRVWEEVAETRGSERETYSIFLSFFVLCFKYRIGPVGGGGGGRGRGKHGIIL